MKKVLCIILSVLMLCTLSACDAANAPTKEVGKTTEATQQVKEETFGVGETAVFKDLKFTANEIKESSGTEYFKPAAGKTFVGVEFTIENVSDKEQAVSSLLLFEGYANDVKCDYSVNAACAFDDGTLDGTLAPGKKLVGWYALEVPSDWTAIELHVQADLLSNSTAKFVFKK